MVVVADSERQDSVVTRTAQSTVLVDPYLAPMATLATSAYKRLALLPLTWQLRRAGLSPVAQFQTRAWAFYYKAGCKIIS